MYTYICTYIHLYFCNYLFSNNIDFSLFFIFHTNIFILTSSLHWHTDTWFHLLSVSIIVELRADCNPLCVVCLLTQFCSNPICTKSIQKLLTIFQIIQPNIQNYPPTRWALNAFESFICSIFIILTISCFETNWKIHFNEVKRSRTREGFTVERVTTA